MHTYVQAHVELMEEIADPLLESAGTRPRFLMNDALVTSVEQPLTIELPTATLDDEENLKDNAIALVAWIKDFQDQVSKVKPILYA